MTTARQIIKSAMKKAGILTQGESPTSEESNDALETLNDLVESWSNDSLIIYARTQETFNLSGGVSSYTIGSGGDFNTTRPIEVVSGYVTIGSTDYDLNNMTEEQYMNISYKAITGTPEFINYNNGYPLGTLRLYPVPAGSYTMTLLTEKPIATFALNTDVDLPAGWKRALIYSLAVELSAEYGQEPPPSVVAIAERAVGSIKKSVSKVRTFDAYPAIRVNNIYTGWGT